MSKVCRATTILLLHLLSGACFTGCAGLRTSGQIAEKKVPDEREILFDRAVQLDQSGDYKAAESLFFRITREPGGPVDPVYDNSLWYLARRYEKTDQAEKALLSLDELSKRESSVIPMAKIKFALIKNHYRVTNYYQARGLRNEVDADYKSQRITPSDLFEALYHTTDLYYDRHILDELEFLGDIQKYFFYIMESDLTPENEKLTELLILYYDGFIASLGKKHISSEVKRQLIVSLLDQLRKFDRYKIAGVVKNPLTIGRFSEYSDTQQKNLTERLTNDK